MKIFLCKGSFCGPVSGADQLLISYALHLCRAGVQPTVAVLCPFSARNPHYQRAMEAGVKVLCVGRHPLYLFLLCVRAIAKRIPGVRRWKWLTDWETLLYYTCVWVLRRHRPDVMHVLVEGGVFLMAAHAAKVPVMYQENAIPRYCSEVEEY